MKAGCTKLNHFTCTAPFKYNCIKKGKQYPLVLFNALCC